MKVVLILMGVFVFTGLVFGLIFNLQGDTMIEEEIQYEKLYQGPVPEGYDEQVFRETGMTTLINQNNSGE